MLRYFHLLSLLIIMCININFCYEYTINNDSSLRSRNRKLIGDRNIEHRKRNFEQRRFRNRRAYDSEYDKDPVAHIDVASFINSSEDEALEEDDPYDLHLKNMKDGKNYVDYDNLIDKNSKENENEIEYYSNRDSANQEDSSGSVNTDINLIKDDKLLQRFENIPESSQILKHNLDKKCALRNIKLPFFSRNKSITTKGTKTKRRKLNDFINRKKDPVVSKTNKDFLPERNIPVNQDAHKYYKINKRSYIDRLCPACKRKFTARKKLDSKGYGK